MVTGARPKVAASTRPVPERRPEFSHLTLDGLRAYRRALTAEEGRVSYWRRLIQARLDVVADVDAVHDPASHDRFRSVFAESRAAGRQALVAVVPVDDVPPLPDLEALWARELRPYDHSAHLTAAARPVPRRAPAVRVPGRAAPQAVRGDPGAHRAVPRGPHPRPDRAPAGAAGSLTAPRPTRHPRSDRPSPATPGRAPCRPADCPWASPPGAHTVEDQ